MAGWKTLASALAVTGMLVMIIPAYGSVIVNNQLSLQTHSVKPFIQLSNNTSSLPSSNVEINSYGNVANVSMSGTWKLSNTSSPKNIYGFISQELYSNVDAYSYVEVTQMSGNSHLSKLKLYLNQSGSPGQLELNFSNGSLSNYGIPVKIGVSTPLNFSISFSPYTTSSKIIQYYYVYLSLNVVSFANSTGGSVHTDETVNIAITEQIF
ncbi:hypothetical protein IX51_07855 [uncultured archaeon]|nr:hypothetical protein IX51_07855 [uncultured archaeon]HKJ96127.1 hypothetical protein [Thermoplasmataceae archaeon]